MSDPFSLFYVFINWIPEYVLWLVLYSNNSKQDQILLVEIYILFTLTQISDKQCFQKKKSLELVSRPILLLKMMFTFIL